LEKFLTEEIFLIFFYQKLQFTASLASIKGVQAKGEPFSLQSHPKLRNMKFLNFFLFLWVIFAPLDPDPDPDPLT
jgi:hypothetical protein